MKGFSGFKSSPNKQKYDLSKATVDGKTREEIEKEQREANLKEWRKGGMDLLNWIDERNSKKFRDMMDKHMDIDPSKEIKIKKK